MGLGTEAKTKASMEEANYRSAGDDGKSCSNCESFIAPDQCKLVLGTISPGGISDLWSRKPDEGMLAEMLFGGPEAGGQADAY